MNYSSKKMVPVIGISYHFRISHQIIARYLMLQGSSIGVYEVLPKELSSLILRVLYLFIIIYFIL